jgi:hypothetical protein
VLVDQPHSLQQLEFDPGAALIAFREQAIRHTGQIVSRHVVTTMRRAVKA